MNKRQQKHMERLLHGSNVRVGRREYGLSRLSLWNEGIPPFTWQQVYRMLREPTVFIGLRYLKGPIEQIRVHRNLTQPPPNDAPVIHTHAPDPAVATYVAVNLDRLWDRCLDKMLRMIEFGFSSAEVLYEEKNGLPFVVGLREFPPEDVRVLRDKHSDNMVGIRFARSKGENTLGYIMAPGQWLHCVHQQDQDHFYGCSQLLGAYEPWLDLVGPGGAKETTRLFFYKLAVMGYTLKYPVDTVIDPQTGQEISTQDIAREILDYIQTGSCHTMPNSRDEKGNPLWELVPPIINGDGLHFVKRQEFLDDRILRGMGVTPEVMEASDSTGALAGRKVPQAAFYASLQQPVKKLLECIRQQVLEPLVELVFGEADFTIECDNLLQAQPLQQGPGGPPPPDAPPPM